MTPKEIISQMKSQSTWRLYFFSLITLGVYTALYVQQQSQKLNTLLPNDPISGNLVSSVLVTYCISTIVAIATFFVPPEHALNMLSNAFNLSSSILALIWAFQFRQRINALMDCRAGEINWFHGGWTFFFTVFYINYKINVISESYEEFAIVD